MKVLLALLILANTAVSADSHLRDRQMSMHVPAPDDYTGAVITYREAKYKLEPFITEKDVLKDSLVAVDIPGAEGKVALSIELVESAAARNKIVTSGILGQRILILVDYRIKSNPRVVSPSEESLMISGDWIDDD